MINEIYLSYLGHSKEYIMPTYFFVNKTKKIPCLVTSGLKLVCYFI